MIDLPTTPGPASLSWHYVDFGGRMTPPLGGEVQRVNRLGNRLSLMVDLPPMPPAAAKVWISSLMRGVSEGVRYRIRQRGVEIGAPGAPVVDGDGQGGAALTIRGGTPRYAFREGQFVSLLSEGRRYVHMVTAPALLDAAGGGTIPIVPMLRVEPADGDVLEVAAPIIEGLPDDGGLGWVIPQNRLIVLSFLIAEMK